MASKVNGNKNTFLKKWMGKSKVFWEKLATLAKKKKKTHPTYINFLLLIKQTNHSLSWSNRIPLFAG